VLLLLSKVDTELLDLMMKHGADVNAQVNGANKYSGRVSYAQRDPNFTQSNEGMTVLYSVAANNTGSSRTAHITIAGEILTVTQDGLERGRNQLTSQ
jgi:hypothetical protein